MDNDRQTVRIILNEKLTSFYTEDFARILNDYLQNMDIGSIKKANSISVPNGCEPSVCDVEFEITANEIPDTDIVLEKTSEILDNINVGAGTVIEYCGKKRTTGTLESLTVDISGYNDISESTDINSITEDLVHSLKGIGEPLSSFTENGITKLYFYGSSRESMHEAAKIYAERINPRNPGINITFE